MGGRLIEALAGDAEVAALFSDAADVAAMLRFEAALAEAEAEAGLVGADAAAAIVAAAAGFRADHEALARGMAADGVAVPALTKALKAAVGPEFAAAVHKGATSQDATDTSLALRLADLSALLDRRLAGLIAALEAIPGDVPLMAHTRMQRALPFTSAAKLESWRRPLLLHRERLAALTPRLAVVQLGGPVGDRGSFGGHGDAIAAGVARRLGLGDAPCWHGDRSRIVEFAGWLALVAGTLGKIGQDVALLAQNEVAAVRLAGGGASSAMPHKSNPVAAEVLVALARHAGGLAGTLNQALVHENERSGAAWTLEWLTLPALAEATGAATRIAAELLAGLRFLPDEGR